MKYGIINIDLKKIKEDGNWTRFLMDIHAICNSDVLSVEDLVHISGFANVAKFKRDNNCSEEEYNAYMEWGNERLKRSQYFKADISLATFRGDTEAYIKRITDSKSKMSVKILDKDIPFRLFENYWKFIVNVNLKYVDVGVYEPKRARLHDKIFKHIGLNRIDHSETDHGKEILRICDMLDRSENTSYDNEVRGIIAKLKSENLLK